MSHGQILRSYEKMLCYVRPDAADPMQAQACYRASVNTTETAAVWSLQLAFRIAGTKLVMLHLYVDMFTDGPGLQATACYRADAEATEAAAALQQPVDDSCTFHLFRRVCSPMGQGCEPTIATGPMRRPASSMTSRRTASSADLQKQSLCTLNTHILTVVVSCIAHVWM